MTTDTNEKIRAFFSTYPQRVFEKRQIILRPDEPLAYVFYMIEGRVSQYDITPSGNEVVVNAFKPDAFFPMSSALNNPPNLYYFEASTRVKAHATPPSDAVQFLKDNPDVTFDLLTRVYRGVDGVLRRMAHLMGGGSKSRLLFELQNAAQRFGEIQQDGSITIDLSQSDLARHSGLARETVSRNMQELKAAGLLTISPHSMVLKSLADIETLLGTNL